MTDLGMVWSMGPIIATGNGRERAQLHACHCVMCYCVVSPAGIVMLLSIRGSQPSPGCPISRVGGVRKEGHPAKKGLNHGHTGAPGRGMEP